MKPMRYVFALSLLSASLIAAAQEINFGVISTDSASVQRERWEPLFRDMEKRTGLTVKAFTHLTTLVWSKRCALTKCKSPGTATRPPSTR